MELTKQQAIENHRKMWRWIAAETLRRRRKVQKWEYFDHFEIPNPLNDCYCCEYAYDHSERGDDDCTHCPIAWDGIDCCDRYLVGDDEGLYVSWRHTDDYETAAVLAKQIAELPERKD